MSLRSVGWVTLVTGSFAVVVGCSKQSGSPGSCYRERDSTCTEYSAAESVAAQRMCQGFRWTSGTNTCPKENRIGACVRENGHVTEMMYSGPPNQFTPDIARSTCERAGGTFNAL
ncbi:hypothetical protein AKJ09_00882 [Labilithrix luteola]|uniref:Lipoprotein n=1 Tax=Labilithrix luteola TaxID=1391654 RepID=A0A0K1PL15_9BACT|nr:hypothetical protein [Labilithrix luteola]AKU94218.1 hypothetical protein AKJ09_00882 [Labilithrix luteola]